MKIVIVILFVLLLSDNLLSQDLDSIRTVLCEIIDENGRVRDGVMPTIKAYGYESVQMDSLNMAIHKFDSTALVTVTKVIEQYGWLGKSKIGKKANSTLFIIVQHASLEIMDKYFPLLKRSAEEGESGLIEMATMQDRILIRKGKKQIYGTQYGMAGADQVLLPMDDIQKVNDRRKKIGLKPVD